MSGDGSSWSGLRSVPGLLDPGTRAPIPVPSAEPLAYRKALVLLLERAEIPRGSLEAGLSTGSALLHGTQEILAAMNRLLGSSASRESFRRATRELLGILASLGRDRAAAYVLGQIADIAAARQGVSTRDWPLEDLPRRKDFLAPFEVTLDALSMTKEIEPSRLGQLLVHLDDLYDDASVQLQRLHALCAIPLEKAREAGPAYLRRLYAELVRASFSDHLLAEDQGGQGSEPGVGTGLLALLPELLRVADAG